MKNKNGNSKQTFSLKSHLNDFLFPFLPISHCSLSQASSFSFLKLANLRSDVPDITGGVLNLGQDGSFALCLVHSHVPIPVFSLIHINSVLINYHIQNLLVSKGIKVHKDEGLESILKRSRCHKGRLLYYFPAQQGQFSLQCLFSYQNTYIDI